MSCQQPQDPVSLIDFSFSDMGNSLPQFARSLLVAIAGQPLDILRRAHPSEAELATLDKMLRIVVDYDNVIRIMLSYRTLNMHN